MGGQTCEYNKKSLIQILQEQNQEHHGLNIYSQRIVVSDSVRVDYLVLDFSKNIYFTYYIILYYSVIIHVRSGKKKILIRVYVLVLVV